jgi:hypothetical protein
MFGIEIVRIPSGLIEKATCPASDIQDAIATARDLLEKARRWCPEAGADGFLIRDATGEKILFRSWEQLLPAFAQTGRSAG